MFDLMPAISHRGVKKFTGGCDDNLWMEPEDVKSGYYTPPNHDFREQDQHNEALGLAAVSLEDRPLVAVLGVGYVGSHLVSSFSHRYDVLGFDTSESKIRMMKQKFLESTNITFTSDPKGLTNATHILIAVPTLLLPDRTIDSSFLKDALETVSMFARTGATVVIESSAAVGMTRQLLGPVAIQRKLFAGMSPERVDPGRTEPPIQNIPKIVSGLDDIAPGSLDRITQLYTEVFDHIVPVSRPEVAEMSKLYENCQRMLCIAYANEMADACIPHGIDPFEVCSASATKPFGYIPMTPGLGVGGHCIPINPHYLFSNSHFPLLQAATQKMQSRPFMIAKRALVSLLGDPLPKYAEVRPRILVAGIAFKVGQSNLSHSPGFDLAKGLVQSLLAEVMFADALVEQSAVPQIPRLDDADWNERGLETFDLIIVAYKQDSMDMDVLTRLQGKVRVEIWCDRK